MRTVLLLICLSLLAACAQTSTATPSAPALTPTRTTITATPSATPTAIPSATPTVVPTSIPLAVLPKGCTRFGNVISAELADSSRGYAYSYRVYLPPCFDAEGEARYPVLYLIPGSRSSPDSWFKAEVPEEMYNLILTKKIPPMIVVSTDNTDSDPSGEIIFNELIPAIESQYPITTDRRYRLVAGGSLGGITAYRLAFQHPDFFGSAGLFGSGVISGEEVRVRQWLSQMNDANRVRVFLNSGTGDPYMLQSARAMKSILDEEGIQNELYVDEGEHHYKFWVPNFERYFTWVLPGS